MRRITRETSLSPVMTFHKHLKRLREYRRRMAETIKKQTDIEGETI